MATDGVKIIDGDTAYDTYWGIMDLYDNGASIETIKKQKPFPQAYYFDDFDYEIYTTAYALAMWEIGGLDDVIISEVKQVIEKGECVKVWTEEADAKLGKARQKELDKLWNKINSENLKIRKPKKYKKVEKFLYNKNEVLSFQLSGNYHATVLLDVHQYRGECTYHFAKIMYKGKCVPTMEDILSSEIVGRKIPNGHKMDMTKLLSMGFEELMKQGGIDEVLKKEAERTQSYDIGMCVTGIDHKNLINITDKFIKIGQLNVREEFNKTGSLGGALTFDDLTHDFNDLEEYIKVFKTSTFKISDFVVNQ